MSWQKIETFPSEGSQSIFPCLILFSWSDVPHVAKRHFGKWLIAWDEYEVIDQLAITHWMPLPPPPEATP